MKIKFLLILILTSLFPLKHFENYDEIGTNNLNYNSIQNWSSYNDDNKNIWFKINQININLNYDNDNFLFSIPINFLQKMNGNSLFELTYVFGSQNNLQNSSLRTDSNKFNNNAFNIIVPKSVFYSKNNTILQNIYANFDLHLKTWYYVNKKWLTWYHYHLIFLIDFQSLLNINNLSIINNYFNKQYNLEIPYYFKYQITKYKIAK